MLDGSDSHLAGYVKNIEKHIGEGNYQAQVLPQEQVDELMGRYFFTEISGARLLAPDEPRKPTYF